CCLAATSTQQPWQRRLQLLIIETYRNGGEKSPRFSRALWRCTDSMPPPPLFHARLHRRPGGEGVMQPQAPFSHASPGRPPREGGMAQEQKRGGGRTAPRRGPPPSPPPPPSSPAGCPPSAPATSSAPQAASSPRSTTPCPAWAASATTWPDTSRPPRL